MPHTNTKEYSVTDLYKDVRTHTYINIQNSAIHLHTHAYIFVHIHTHAYIFGHIHNNLYTHTYTHINTYKNINTQIRMYS